MILFRSLLALFLFAPVLRAGDWPQWLGPQRNGCSSESVPTWHSSPRVLWRRSVGEGHSSPVVAEGKVFLFTKLPDKEAEALTAYDAVTGKHLWQTSYPRRRFSSLFGNGPRATPTIAEGRVWTNGATGIMTCFAADSGKQLWQVDTQTKFRPPALKFGVSCSPLRLGDKILVNVGAKGASVVAFDADKGTVRWHSQDDSASYSSPIVIGQATKQQAIFVTGRDLLSLNPNNGRLFWKFPMIDLLSESSSTPVHAGKMVVASSVTLGSTGYRLGTRGDQPTAKQTWKNLALTCYFSTPVAVGPNLYMVTGTFIPPIQATLRCVEARTGKQLWSHPKVGRYHAALIRTGNDRLLMMEDSGTLVLLEPSPQGYHELARSKICGETWAHPALTNGRLYVRDNTELLCLQLGK